MLSIPRIMSQNQSNNILIELNKTKQLNKIRYLKLSHWIILRNILKYDFLKSIFVKMILGSDFESNLLVNLLKSWKFM